MAGLPDDIAVTRVEGQELIIQWSRRKLLP